MKTLKSIVALLVLLGVAAGCHASPPVANASKQLSASDEIVLPTGTEAADAISALMELSELRARMTVKLGTCIPAVEAKHVGQVACTVAVKIGAGSSETQADFYKDGAKWIAQPSVSQDELPFPDPKLQ